MKENSEFEIKLFDYNTYKAELLELRMHYWKIFNSESNSGSDSEMPISKKDELIDLAALHCGVFNKQKLIASHRLKLIKSIEELPFSNHFEKPKIIDFKWYAYGENGANYVEIMPPVVSTGRMVIHPDYRKKGISKQILNFWIEYSKNNSIKSLVSYPSPWMVDSLVDVGFLSEKNLGRVFSPLPTIDITLVMKKF